ncbi:hypothetical protein G7Y89_g6092 [Cudoniella acicularis]|uniref:Period circadian protein n=1 Tax=Cudoniella acicularis TaxID=354080 RepID=A0A8H4RNK1_9HELO|nr:hypothetical protein G7Y89_g6092 [Cudoniella acicularis]
MSTMDKIKDKLHIGTTGTSATHTTSTTTNTSTHPTTHHHGTAEGVAGPHNSRVANAADPRFDSDLDGSRTVATGTGLGAHSTTGHHHHGTHGTATGVGAGTGTYGTQNTTGGYNGTGTGLGGNTGSTTTSTGLGRTTGSTTTPHSSNLANKLDPRVDSMATNTSTGYTGTNTGTTGGISQSTNAGPHQSNLANKIDPRVDSDLSGPGNRHGAHTTTAGIGGVSGSHATLGSGTAQNTAGPHNSDIMNKLDPVRLPSPLLKIWISTNAKKRVDADLDGSKTYGGNKTYTDTTTNRDVHDASKVPPSVFAAHHGEPEILHGDHGNDRARRHSVVSHQEKLSGI